MEWRLERAFDQVLPHRRRLGCKTSGRDNHTHEFGGEADTYPYQARPPLRTREAVDFGILFKIERQRIPVMFVEIKPLPAINSLSARAEADSQMRQRFADFYDASSTIFTGISAFGHIVCKYELDKDDDNRITPEAVQNSINYVVDVAPRARWDLDLTTAEGAARVLNIFQTVKNVMVDEVARNCL